MSNLTTVSDANTHTFCMKISPALLDRIQKGAAERDMAPSAFARQLLEKALQLGAAIPVLRPAIENRRRRRMRALG